MSGWQRLERFAAKGMAGKSMGLHLGMFFVQENTLLTLLAFVAVAGLSVILLVT